TLSEKTKSKSSVFTSTNGAGLFVPALLTRISNGACSAIAFLAASTSRTSSVRCAAFCPRARIASAACSISFVVRAASVTSAPASASAEAAARPMPRPAPVTSARLPSSRKEGVLVSSIAMLVMPGLVPGIHVFKSYHYQRRGWHAQLGLARVAQGRYLPQVGYTRLAVTSPAMTGLFRRLGVGHVAAPVAPHTNIRLLGMTEKAFQHAETRAIFADHGAGFVGEHFLVDACFHDFAHPQPTGVARRFLRRQRVVSADHLVAIGDVGARPKKQ